MIIKAKESASLREIEADACVIGSGAGGAVMAKEGFTLNVSTTTGWGLHWLRLLLLRLFL